MTSFLCRQASPDKTEADLLHQGVKGEGSEVNFSGLHCEGKCSSDHVFIRAPRGTLIRQRRQQH